MRMSKNSGKILWGIFFILAAVYVIVSKFVKLPDISVFSIILTILFASVLVEGIRKLDFWRILFPIAFICIIYAKPLGITELVPWTVLGAALLGSIGLSMIFKKKSSWGCSSGNEEGRAISSSGNEQCSGEHIWIKNSFGSGIKYISSDNFCNAELENSFGSLTVYFDNAVIQGECAYVNLENSFGETELYIPKEWNTVNQLERSFGSVSEEGMPQRTSVSTLYLRGEASFGSIVIHYI